MSITYKPLTPGEALDALIRNETIEWRDPGFDWIRETDRNRTFWAEQNDRGRIYRLVIEQKPETVEEVMICLGFPRDSQRRWRRIFDAFKSELREEMAGKDSPGEE